ncbi:hypothetical protein [Croceicoccus mobilis]|nr:hypothetical protein [Croceicoccus mobilis]
MASKAAKVPASFWIIAGLSLVWNSLGAFQYAMTQAENAAYLSNFSPEERMYFTRLPMWQIAFWALGVWGSVAGSLLLLLRSRWALAAFIVSLLGLVITTLVSLFQPAPESLTGLVNWVMTGVVWAILIALIWYSRRAMARGWIA